MNQPMIPGPDALAPQTGQVEAPAVPVEQRAARHRGDRWIRAAAVLVVILLAGVAMYVSYRHQFDLALGYGEEEETARLFPITIDGVIIMASLIMLYCARLRLPVPPLARLALWAGILATLTANAAHGWDSGWGGRLVSAAPAAVLVLAYELLMWLIRTMRQINPEQAAVRVVYREVPVEVEVAVEVRDIPTDRFEAARWAYQYSLIGGRRKLGRRALSDRFGLEVREAAELIAEVDTEHAPAPPVQELPETVPFHPEPVTAGSGNGRTEVGG